MAQAGWTQTAPTGAPAECDGVTGSPTLAPQGHAINLTSAQNDTGNDFGNQQQQATKSGIKFDDLNGDGDQDAGEPGL